MASEEAAVGVEIPATGSLVERVRDAMRAHIRETRPGPGDMLPSENVWAVQLGVSRPVVREAISSLSALKLITTGNGRRARIAELDTSVLAHVLDHAVSTAQITVQQILDVRRTVEMRAVELAALRRTDREAAEIVSLSRAMRSDIERSERVMEHDIAFHEAIARASKNPMFVLVAGSFHFVTRQTWPITWAVRASANERSAGVACHEAIAQAIVESDAPAAMAKMAEHFDSTARVLLAAGVN